MGYTGTGERQREEGQANERGKEWRLGRGRVPEASFVVGLKQNLGTRVDLGQLVAAL